MGMFNFKQQIRFVRNHIFVKNGGGFTLIELMVVLTLFVIITGLILANYAGLRTARNLKIAQNELVTNFRKVASYTLSSRALNGKQAVQFYLLKFDFTTPDRYTIEALYDVSSSPKLYPNVETIFLPQGVRFAEAEPFRIDRPTPTIQYPNNPTDSNDVSLANANISKCLLVAYKLPFSTIIANGGTDSVNVLNTGCRFNGFSTDDYSKVKDFVANSFSSTVSNNSVVTLFLTDTAGTLSKTVTLNGITGGVTFSQ